MELPDHCQYDRWEKRNLFGSAGHRELQKSLHQQTRSWMKRLGDKGAPYDEIIRAYMSPEDLEARRAGKFVKPNGVLRGRPADRLKAAG